LYVEDNDKLRTNASSLFKKIFNTVYVASDGREGLASFKKHGQQIVITDIKMPYMDGMNLIKHIKKINPTTKVIIMSSFDDSDYLYNAIELGVFRYLKKPVNVHELIDMLSLCIAEIREDINSKLFNANLQNVFNYQSSIVIMMKKAKPIFVNHMFLEYFNVENLKEFNEKYVNLGNVFLKHDSFLYDKEGENWFDEVTLNPQKLYNTKLLDMNGNFRHFILKYQDIPDKDSCGILSFDDVTELNLLKLYDKSQSDTDNSIKDSKTMFKLLEVLQRNNAKIELHNFYKGLSITNDAVIIELNDNTLKLKTKYLQQKAIQYDGKTIIVSEALPKPILCANVANISFDNQSVVFSDFSFVNTSPISRKTVRVIPDCKQTVSLFLGENKFHGDIKIQDISLDAVKLELNALPAGLKNGDNVHLDIVLEIDKKPIILNSKATMYRVDELKYTFNVVFMFEDIKKSDLVKYITTQQMAIIREFKGL
jgi:CheY-like chemotaxis protein